MDHGGACAEADKPLFATFVFDFEAQEVENRTVEPEQPDEMTQFLSERL